MSGPWERTCRCQKNFWPPGRPKAIVWVRPEQRYVGECREYTELCLLTQFQPGEVVRAFGQPVLMELRGVIKKNAVFSNGLPIFEQHPGQSIRKRGPQR